MQITKIEANIKPTYIKKLRVAAYARVSTDSDEQLDSLENQKYHYENEIKFNPDYEFAGLYFDEGISGTKMAKRDGLQNLLKDCRKGKIDKIITKSISRFSRNLTDCLSMVKELTSLGIGIYFEKENIDTLKMDSDLILSIMSSLAESESRSISENLKWSIKNRFKDGTYLISKPCYGYDRVDDELIINTNEAKIVKEIFERYAKGESGSAIAKDLNIRNIKSRKDTKWSSTTVLNIIQNEKYTGDAIFQKTYTDENFNRCVNNGELHKYYVEDHHKAIVSKELFKKANDLYKKRQEESNYKVGSNLNHNRYCFTGKIICGECGSTFTRRIYSRTGYNYAGWICKKKIDDKKCSMKFVREESLKYAFVIMLNKLSSTYKDILLPFSKEVLNNKKVVNDPELKEIDNELSSIIDKKLVFKDALNSKTLDINTYNAELTRLSLEQTRLINRKNHILKGLNEKDELENDIRNLLKVTSNYIKYHDFDEGIFNLIIKNVKVIDHFEVIFNLKCGLCFKENLEEYL